ncbi:hypothetical protein K439DRAFT_1532400 [Ramaria rubella]|nr:hypothetical protein K439DRAFT_1532400 [Ramaria rubella]
MLVDIPMKDRYPSICLGGFHSEIVLRVLLIAIVAHHNRHFELGVADPNLAQKEHHEAAEASSDALGPRAALPEVLLYQGNLSSCETVLGHQSGTSLILHGSLPGRHRGNLDEAERTMTGLSSRISRLSLRQGSAQSFYFAAADTRKWYLRDLAKSRFPFGNNLLSELWRVLFRYFWEMRHFGPVWSRAL